RLVRARGAALQRGDERLAEPTPATRRAPLRPVAQPGPPAARQRSHAPVRKRGPLAGSPYPPLPGGVSRFGGRTGREFPPTGRKIAPHGTSPGGGYPSVEAVLARIMASPPS